MKTDFIIYKIRLLSMKTRVLRSINFSTDTQQKITLKSKNFLTVYRMLINN